MKNKLILALILTIFFIGFIAIRFFILDNQNAYGSLKILSSPTTSIFINNIAIGKTPFESKYKTGEYILKLIPEGTATESASWTGKIKIYKNALTYINFELGLSDINTAGEIFTVSKMEKAATLSNTGEIYIETDPQGAIISLDNDEKGVAPLVLENVLKGDHEISVFMPNFFRRTQKVNVIPGYRINSFFKLAIDESQKMITPNPEEKEATKSGQTQKLVIIKETPSGWLRVRKEASIEASEAAKIKPGGKYPFIEEKNGWYKIRFNGEKEEVVEGEFDEGWISSQYATLQ